MMDKRKTNKLQQSPSKKVKSLEKQQSKGNKFV